MNKSGTGSAHPSMEKLRTFGLGQLQQAEASAIEEHVARCEPCCRTLAAVGSDTLIALLRVARQAAAPEAATIAPTDGLASGSAPRSAADGTAAEAPAEASLPGLPPELLHHPRYRVLALLGSGGMGAVYKAEHRLMERPVALKVMARGLLNNAAMVERFRREVKAAACLSHPNIVTAHDAEQAGDLHLLVMEYVEGTDLARVLSERGPLPVADACDYVRQAAAGLQHAHEHGMIHRDIKPHNLMLTPRGQVKVLDFGLARLASEAGSQPGSATAQGTILGTVDYMAPEQANDAHQADIRSDIYSLGCTLYHLLSGRPPFPQGTVVQKIMAHTERTPTPLSELRPDVPPGLARVIARMMAKAPGQRYQTPAQVRVALEPFAEVPVVVVARPVAQQSSRSPRGPAASGRTEELPPPGRQRQGAKIIPIERPERARPRRRWPVVLAVLLPLLFGALLAGGVAVYRIQTDHGELVITTDNADVEVVIRQKGKVVRIIDTKTGKEITLDSGHYELELTGKAEGLKLSPDKFTIRRGDTVVARVERLRKPLPKPVPVVKRPEPPAEICREAFNGPDDVPAHIYRVTFSPNGRYFLAAGDAGVRSPVRVYSGTTGKLVSEFVPPDDEGWTVARFSPDSTQVLSSGHQGKVVHLWEAATGKEIHKLEGHTEAIASAAFSPDGKRIVSGSGDKTLRLWDAGTGKLLHTLEGHTDSCVGTFSPDGKWILSYSPDNTLRAWDAQTGKAVWKQEGQVPPDNPRIFSPDGSQVLSFGGDGSIRLWETATGKAVRELKGNADTQRAHFLPGGRQLVSWGKDKKLRFWDLAGGKEVRSLDLGEDLLGEPDNVAVSPDGRLLLTTHSDQTMRVRDLASGEELHRYALAPAPNTRSLAVAPDGRYAAAGSFRGWVYLWRLPAPPPPPKAALLHAVPYRDEQQGFPAYVGQTGISSDGRLFFGAGDAGPCGRIRVFDLATGKQVQELVPEGDVFYSYAQFLPGSTHLVSSYTKDKDLYLWDIATGKVVRKFEGHAEPGAQFAVAPDGKRLLSWGDDKTVRLWDVDTGKELRKLEGHTDKAAGVFSPDGKQALTFSPDRTLRLWDVDSGKQLHKLEGHTGACTGSFSPDGTQILSYGPDGTIRLWDPKTGKETRRYEGSKAGVIFAGFVADGRLVVARGDEHSDDKKFRTWDAASGKLLGEIDYDYAKYGTDAWTITASPDGRLALMQVKNDASVRVLELPGGKEIHRYDNCPGARSWSFAPDGTTVVAGSFRAGMYVFRLPAPPAGQ